MKNLPKKISKADKETLAVAKHYLQYNPDLLEHLENLVPQIAEQPVAEVIPAAPVATPVSAMPEKPAITRSSLYADEKFDDIDSPLVDSPYTKVRKKAETVGVILPENWRTPLCYTPRRLNRMVDAVQRYKEEVKEKVVQKRLFTA